MQAEGIKIWKQSQNYMITLIANWVQVFSMHNKYKKNLTLSSLVRASGSLDFDISLLYLNKLTCKFQKKKQNKFLIFCSWVFMRLTYNGHLLTAATDSTCAYINRSFNHSKTATFPPHQQCILPNLQSGPFFRKNNFSKCHFYNPTCTLYRHSTHQQDELGSRCLEGDRAYSAKGEHYLEGNHGNQATNQSAPPYGNSSVEYLPQPILPIRGWVEWEQEPADITGCESQWSTKISKAKQSWDTQSHVSPCRPSSHPAQARLPGAQPLTC